LTGLEEAKGLLYKLSFAEPQVERSSKQSISATPKSASRAATPNKRPTTATPTSNNAAADRSRAPKPNYSGLKTNDNITILSSRDDENAEQIKTVSTKINFTDMTDRERDSSPTFAKVLNLNFESSMIEDTKDTSYSSIVKNNYSSRADDKSPKGRESII
jgi:hypothetical protein